MAGIASVSMGGRGSVNAPYYRNGGCFRKQGLRNKRRTHWERVRREEALQVEIRELRSQSMADRYSEEYSGPDYSNME